MRAEPRGRKSELSRFRREEGPYFPGLFALRPWSFGMSVPTVVLRDVSQEDLDGIQTVMTVDDDRERLLVDEAVFEARDGDTAPCFSSVKPLRSASSLTRTSRASKDSPM